MDGKGDQATNDGPAPIPSARRTFEWWHGVALGAVLGLAGYFVYAELSRDRPVTAPVDGAHTSLPPKVAALIDEASRLQQVVQENPSDTQSVLTLANVYHDLSPSYPRLAERAIEMYQRYLMLKPEDPDARVDLGIMYFTMSQLDSAQHSVLAERAVQEMERVTMSRPSHQPAHFNLGVVYLGLGDADRARGWFQRSIAIDPESELARRARQRLEEISN